MIPGVVSSELRQPAVLTMNATTGTANASPSVTTAAVTQFDQSSAQFNLSVTTAGTTRTGWQWRRDIDGSYPFSHQRADAGTTYVAALGETDRTYFVRAYATNINGVATFSATLNMRNDAGTYQFEYGGSGYELSTSPVSISGNGPQTVTASVSGLTTGQLTYVRVRVNSSQPVSRQTGATFTPTASTAFGSEVSFKTYGLRTFTDTTPGNVETWTPPAVGTGKAINSVFNVLLVAGGGAGEVVTTFYEGAGGGGGGVGTWSGPFTFSSSFQYVVGAGGGFNNQGAPQSGQFSAAYLSSTLTVNGGGAGSSTRGGSSASGQLGGTHWGYADPSVFGNGDYGYGGGGGAGGPGGSGTPGRGGNGGAAVTVGAAFGGGTYGGGGDGHGGNSASGAVNNGASGHGHAGAGGGANILNRAGVGGLVRFQYWGP